jgi:hypothetical protein
MPNAKQLRKEIDEILSGLDKITRDNISYPGFVVKESAILNAKIAELSEITTRRIVCLTWALVALTAGLLFFTVILYKDTHQLIQREKLTNDSSIQNKQTPVQ